MIKASLRAITFYLSQFWAHKPFAVSGGADIYKLHLVGSGLKGFVKGSQEELLSTNVLKILARAH